jgi:hypothetical protein
MAEYTNQERREFGDIVGILSRENHGTCLSNSMILFGFMNMIEFV